MLLLHIPCLLNQINFDNLWLQFDTTSPHYMPIYEIADEVYLISFLKPVVSLKMAAGSTWKVFPDISWH